MVKRPSDKTPLPSHVDSFFSSSSPRESILTRARRRLVSISLTGTAMVLRIHRRSLRTSLSKMISGFVVCRKLSYVMVTRGPHLSQATTSSRRIVLVELVLLRGPSAVAALLSSSTSPFHSLTSILPTSSLTTTSPKSTQLRSIRTHLRSPSSTPTFLLHRLPSTATSISRQSWTSRIATFFSLGILMPIMVYGILPSPPTTEETPLPTQSTTLLPPV